MKYLVRLEGQSFLVSVLETEGRLTVEVDGTPVEIELEEAGQGRYVLFADGRSHDLAISSGSHGSMLAIDGETFGVSIEEWRARRGATGAAATSVDGRAVIRAPMPGKVVRVDVNEGQRVEKGQRLAVLEAMKMENDVLAPYDGCVQEVRVIQGEVVEHGRALLVLEPECHGSQGDEPDRKGRDEDEVASLAAPMPPERTRPLPEDEDSLDG
jgi:biotin carboxyl carrier protein